MRFAKIIQCICALSIALKSTLLYSAQTQDTRRSLAPGRQSTLFNLPSNTQIVPAPTSSNALIPTESQPQQQMVYMPFNILEQLLVARQTSYESPGATSAPTPPTPTVVNLYANLSNHTTTDMQSANEGKAQNDVASAFQNKNKGDATGGNAQGGGGGSSDATSEGGSGGNGGNNTTHNNESSSFPPNGRFNRDDLLNTSKSFLDTCKKHAYKITGIGLLGTYGYLYYHISRAKSVLKDKNSWCNWHKEKNNSQLFTSSQLVNELMFEIATRYSDIMQPQNVALPVQTFFSTINQELKQLQHFAYISTWLKRLHLTAIFPASDKHIQSCTERIERLEGLRKVVAQHITQQQYASITTRGFSIPIKINRSGSPKDVAKKA